MTRGSAWVAGLLAAAMLLAAVPAAWSAAPLQVIVSQVDASGFPDNRLTVRAIGSDGLPLAGLGTSELAVLEDGKPAQVTAVEPLTDAQLNMSTLLAMDTSARMQGQSLPNAQAALTSFVDQAGPNDQMALLAFGNESCQWALGQRFTADKQALEGAIGNVHATGGAPLLDSLMAGLKLMRTLPTGQKAIVLLTSGKDACPSAYQVDDVINEARAQSVPIYAIGLGSTVEKDVLQRMADTTRGEYFSADTSSQLTAIYQQISTRLRTQYTVRYHSAQLSDGKDHAVSVRLTYQGNQADTPEQRYVPPDLPFQVQLVNAATGQPLAANQVLDAPLQIKTVSTTPVLLTKVDYSLDGVPLASVTDPSSPYTLDPRGRSDGLHTLKAVATKWSGQSVETDVPLQLAPPWPPIWVYILLVLLLLILALVGVPIAAGRRVRRCPRCKKKMEPNWAACPYHPELAVAGGAPAGGVQAPPGTPPIVPSPAEPAQSTRTSGIGPAAGDSTVAGSGRGMGGPGAGGTPSAEGTLLLNGAQPPLAVLVVATGPRAGQQFPLADAVVSLGRDPLSNGVILEDPAVSQRHAQVRRVNGGFQLTDLDTRNGTRVNGRPVTRHQLRPNDRITIGETELVFLSADSSAASR